MPNLHIRDVPKEVLEALKEQAKHHGRSLQEEVRRLLEERARYPVHDFLEITRTIRRRLGRRKVKWLDSATLIRQDRDR